MRFITRTVFVVTDKKGTFHRVFGTQTAVDTFCNRTHFLVDEHPVEFERETMTPEEFLHEVQG